MKSSSTAGTMIRTFTEFRYVSLQTKEVHMYHSIDSLYPTESVNVCVPIESNWFW